jgi:hypothetical protein
MFILMCRTLSDIAESDLVARYNSWNKKVIALDNRLGLCLCNRITCNPNHKLPIDRHNFTHKRTSRKHWNTKSDDDLTKDQFLNTCDLLEGYKGFVTGQLSNYFVQVEHEVPSIPHRQPPIGYLPIGTGRALDQPCMESESESDLHPHPHDQDERVGVGEHSACDTHASPVLSRHKPVYNRNGIRTGFYVEAANVHRQQFEK